MEIDIIVKMMKFGEKLNLGCDEFAFRVKREMSATILFWFAVLVFLLLKTLLFK
jgi:hypothetical protein